MRKEALSYLSSFVSGALDFDVVGAAVWSVMLALLTYFVGEFDKALNIFIYSMGIDYITGWLKAAIKKELHSDTGYRGLLKKGGMIAMVSLAHQLDQTAGTSFIRNVFISGYVNTELISIAENADAVGLLPKAAGVFLKQYQEKFAKLQIFK